VAVAAHGDTVDAPEAGVAGRPAVTAVALFAGADVALDGAVGRVEPADGMVPGVGEEDLAVEHRQVMDAVELGLGGGSVAVALGAGAGDDGQSAVRVEPAHPLSGHLDEVKASRRVEVDAEGPAEPGLGGREGAGGVGVTAAAGDQDDPLGGGGQGGQEAGQEGEEEWVDGHAQEWRVAGRF